MDLPSLFDALTTDPRYVENLDWGKVRRGHPEGTVRAHIVELEQNLSRLKSRLTPDHVWKLKVLIHTHDSFKADARQGVPILHPQSHASLARGFLAEFCDDADLLAMVQYHDEPYALWRQFHDRGLASPQRMTSLLESIRDWTLFMAFLIVDGCTAGKSREPLVWFFDQVSEKVDSSIGAQDILP
jgi:hypothetical protein